MTINVPLENTTEYYADKTDTEHDDDTDIESKDVLKTLTGLLWFYANAGPVPEGDHSINCIIHVPACSVFCCYHVAPPKQTVIENIGLTAAHWSMFPLPLSTSH